MRWTRTSRSDIPAQFPGLPFRPTYWSGRPRRDSWQRFLVKRSRAASGPTGRLLNPTRFPYAAVRPSPPTPIAVPHHNTALRSLFPCGVPVWRPGPCQPAHRETVKRHTLFGCRHASFTTHQHCCPAPRRRSPLGVLVRRLGPASGSQPTSTSKNCKTRNAFRAPPCVLHRLPPSLFRTTKRLSVRRLGPASRCGVQVPAQQHTERP